MLNLNSQDKQDITKILVKLYGNQALNWTVNDKVYIELVKILQKSGTCTQAMHFVPRPLIAGNPIGWLKKEIIKGVLKFLLDDKNRHYFSCLMTAAIAKKTDIFLASKGI